MSKEAYSKFKAAYLKQQARLQAAERKSARGQVECGGEEQVRGLFLMLATAHPTPPPPSAAAAATAQKALPSLPVRAPKAAAPKAFWPPLIALNETERRPGERGLLELRPASPFIIGVMDDPLLAILYMAPGALLLVALGPSLTPTTASVVEVAKAAPMLGSL